MLGRGIDQVLPDPVDPVLYEPYVTDARDYVALAEAAHGPIPRPVALDYVWGEALPVLAGRRPDVRIVNLETALTRSDDREHKGINYRLSPENARTLKAAGIDCCALANNHVLDWGEAGLLETLDTLARLGIGKAGAGRDRAAAFRPALLEVEGKGRVLVFAFGLPDSGIPRDWAAGPGRPGVALLDADRPRVVAELAGQARALRRPGDVVVISIHWGANWGYEVSGAHRRLAHALIEEAGASIVHGHSAHHPRGIEVHRGALVLYGCGDFVSDYEGIGGREVFRGDLSVMYLPTLDRAEGRLSALEMVVFRIRNFRLRRAPEADVAWLARTLSREGRPFGTGVSVTGEGTLALSW